MHAGPSPTEGSARSLSLGARVFHPSAELLSRPRCPSQPHFRTVHRDQLGHHSDRPDQANRDHGGHCHHPCAHLLPLCIALSLAKQWLAYFSHPLCEAVHSLERPLGHIPFGGGAPPSKTSSHRAGDGWMGGRPAQACQHQRCRGRRQPTVVQNGSKSFRRTEPHCSILRHTGRVFAERDSGLLPRWNGTVPCRSLVSTTSTRRNAFAPPNRPITQAAARSSSSSPMNGGETPRNCASERPRPKAADATRRWSAASPRPRGCGEKIQQHPTPGFRVLGGGRPGAAADRIRRGYQVCHTGMAAPPDS
jgi:hypothetical protein